MMEIDKTNPYITMILKNQEAAKNSTFDTPTKIETLEDYDLGGVDCEICNNTGMVTRQDENGVCWSRECVCMNARRAQRSIRNSGMSDMVSRYTFLNYQTPDNERARIKAKAIAYCDEPYGWFYIKGTPGSGKTHICTAICSELMKQGKSLRYMLWRDEAVQLKALVTSPEEYASRLNRLKTVRVLYIDDFLKGKITDADINLAFELINSRYNNAKLKTIISTELSIERVLELDEAVGSRIYERSKAYCLSAPSENWRLK